MSTILMAILILAFTIILPWIFIARHRKTLKKKEYENFRRFSSAGSDRDLSFSRQEIIQNKFIGFDGIQQVLMIAELDNDYDITCIPVKELAQCKIDKEYYTHGDTAADKEKILKEIRLVFHLRNNSEPIDVLFYNNQSDSIYLMADMETKAREWQTVISKMIPKSVAVKV
ncbi:hypothetical protein [Ferruginibacter sp. SUN106]|uniref:hypothetical protein n=1 Tax=Ferruginibacter sp. SUN106 TaxID=2978348 RepID=UPI003D3699A5